MSIEPNAAAIEIDELTIARGSMVLIRNATLKIEVGTMVALRGPSGSGKTSFLRVIAGLDGASGGRIRMGGSQWQSASANMKPASRVMLVHQTLALWPHLSARANILTANKGSWPSTADGLIDALEIRGLLDRLPPAMSQGERQRLAIVRALGVTPKVLLLDEPTASLDRQRTLTVMALLQERVRVGMSVVAVTHDPIVAASCGRRLLLEDSRIEEEG